MTSHDVACSDDACPGDDRDCPGRGKCHGCMGWCEQCGDVDGVCGPHDCDVHRCVGCRGLLTYRDREFNAEKLGQGLDRWCLDCYVRCRVQSVLDRGENEMWALECASRAVEHYRKMPA